jgi:alanine-glyoxylate transaminase/serine-glyoxylate transaminase/serine-pyruvate transaminase
MRQQDWDVDVYLTASQKAIGVPPGLALWVVSPAGMTKWRNRSTPVGSYYSDWSSWLPIMESYESLQPSYFATPPVNLVVALSIGLQQILQEGLEEIWARHRLLSEAVKAGVSAMDLDQVPTDPDHAAQTLTCPRYPAGVDAGLLGHVRANGVILAGGLHPVIKKEHFRIGHMGAIDPNVILATLGAVEKGLRQSGYAVEPGVGLAAAQAVLTAQ